MGLEDKEMVVKTSTGTHVRGASTPNTRGVTSNVTGVTVIAPPEEVKVTPYTGSVEDPGKYSTQAPEHYRYARTVLAGQYNIKNVSELTYRVNGLAEQWRRTHGGVWPTGLDLVDWAATTTSMLSYQYGYHLLDPIYNTWDPASQQTITYRNHPVLGTSVIDRNHPAYADTVNEFGQPDGQSAWASFPTYDVNMLPAIIGSLASARGGGSGGGGGGAGRTARAFDRANLAEGATDKWRGWLLEEPDDDTVNDIVSDYISEANAFWMKEAGNLDYDTFLANRIRQEDRFTFLYDKKPDFQSEEEYMSGFRQATSQFGMNDRTELRELEAGAHSGAGLAGFSERVGRTREVRTMNAGSYSQRFAGMAAQTQIGRT